MQKKYLSAEEAIAEAASRQSIRLATGYPGSPGGGIISILEKIASDNINVHWSSNEKIALEKGIGVAINGQNALVCVKSVGLNAMLDPLTVLNLTPTSGGLVIIVGDDPGAYGSQNDQDSRPLARFLNIPWFEPTDVQKAFDLTLFSFDLAVTTGLPVIIRITRSLAIRRAHLSIVNKQLFSFNATEINNESVDQRFVPGPKNAVAKNNELNNRLKSLQGIISKASLNSFVTKKENSIGLILCGSAHFKIKEIVSPDELSNVSNVAVLNSIYPLPEAELLEFLDGIETAIIIEENSPFITEQCKIIAASLNRSINWQSLAKPGELKQRDIRDILQRTIPGLSFFKKNPTDEMPELKSNCTDSRYGEVLDLLDSVCQAHGLQSRYYGDPGCLVTVVDRLYAKYAMGGSISTVFGANIIENDNILNIALVGDSGFFHSAMLALADSAYHGANMPIVLLNNDNAKTTGGQKHPGSRQGSLKYNYETLINSLGVSVFKRINLDDDKKLITAVLNNFITENGLRFLQIDIDLPSNA